MPRRAREVFPNLPHHITQRGNRRQSVFFTVADRSFYLKLLKKHLDEYEVTVLAYCLMTNHVHLVLVPRHPHSLHRSLKAVHSQYAKHINERFGWRGHLWQARYYSSPLDSHYLRTAVRYVELNPVRAGMVEQAEDYPWSSARARIFGEPGEPNSPLALESPFSQALPKLSDWKRYLKLDEPDEEAILKRNHARNLPCGNLQFVSHLERETGRNLTFRPRGRPTKKR